MEPLVLIKHVSEAKFHNATYLGPACFFEDAYLFAWRCSDNIKTVAAILNNDNQVDISGGVPQITFTASFAGIRPVNKGDRYAVGYEYLDQKLRANDQ